MEITCDTIRDITVYQNKKGYRFSVDALILENFIPKKSYKKAIELGAGSAVISLLLAKKLKKIEIQAIELQEALVHTAQKNVVVNNLSNQVTILHEDIKKLRSTLQPEKAELVFTNPPYRKDRTGRVSPFPEISQARHEIAITLDEIISTSAYLLKNRGTFCIVYHPYRLAELITVLKAYRLEPKRMRVVHDRKDNEARIVLIEAVKGAGQWLKVEAPLFIHRDSGEYSDEMKAIFKG